MRADRGRLSNTAAGLIALVVIAVACYFGFTKAVPFRDHFEVRAVFQTSNNLRTGSPVRIAGVTVGEVSRVEATEQGGDSATAWLRLSERALPVHADARASIRPRIFLEGNFFVDLTPGSPSAPELGDGDLIPVNQTSTPVQLDQLLTALQSDTREDLRALLRDYSSALKGRGARGFNRSLSHWEPAYRDSAIAADATLGAAEHDLSEYLRGAGRVAAALDRSPAQLQALVSDFDTTAAAFAARSRELREAVAELPRTLRAAQPALAELNAAFPDLRALARELRPGVRSSTPAIEASTPLVHELRGLVSRPELRGLVGDLRSAVPSLARLSAATVPLYRQVRRAASCQNEVILPWSLDEVGDPTFAPSGPVYQEAVKPLPGLAGESRSGDANGQWFRVLAAGGTNLVTLKPGVFATTALPINGANPPEPDRRPPLDPSVPCETQEKPDLRSVPGAPPPQRRVDVTSPAYRARYERARGRAVRWLDRTVRRQGLSRLLEVTPEQVTPALVRRLAEARGARP
jgi:virulence factor Mce-like protein